MDELLTLSTPRARSYSLYFVIQGGQGRIRPVCARMAFSGWLLASLRDPGDFVPRLGGRDPGQRPGRLRQLSRILGGLVVSAGLRDSGSDACWRSCCPGPPRGWSTGSRQTPSAHRSFCGVLFCAGMVLCGAGRPARDGLGRGNFAASLIPVRDDGRGGLADRHGPPATNPRPAILDRRGFVYRAAYVLIWMFNGKRSHSLIGVLATVCAFYISRLKRPSWPVSWPPGSRVRWSSRSRSAGAATPNYERSFAGFVHFLGDFKVTQDPRKLERHRG